MGKLPATTPCPLGEILEIVANLFHLLLLSPAQYLRGTVPTLHPVPTLSSANYHLPDSCTLPEDGEEFRMAELGGTFGGVAQLQSFGHFQGHTQGSCCWTIHLFPIRHTEPFMAVQYLGTPNIQRSDSMLVVAQMFHMC